MTARDDTWLAIAPCGCVQAAGMAGFLDDFPKERRDFFREAGETSAEVRRVSSEEFEAEWRQRLLGCSHDPKWSA